MKDQQQAAFDVHAKRPLVWVLQGARTGDNAQARELAARLPATIEVKHLKYNVLKRIPNFIVGTGLLSVRDGAETLTAPWPDVVIAIGARSVPVARWIKQQSGGRARLVQMGRPRARLDLFDLVITTPQYGLPSAPNRIELTLPLVPEHKLPEDELALWTNALADLPRPLVAVLVGGPSWPFIMGERELADLVQKAQQLQRRLAASLVVLGSPRTPAEAFAGSGDDLGPHVRRFGWSAGQPNPYRALLRLADRFVVTSDSVSMLAEALHTGKPVDVYLLPFHRQFRLPLKLWPFSLLVRKGYLATQRDVRSLVTRLIDNNHVGVLGQDNGVRARLINNDHDAVASVTALLQEAQG